MAVKFVIDTSSYSAFNRNLFKLERYINPTNEIVIPLVVIGELRAGFKNGNQERKNEQLLQELLDAPNITIEKLTEETTVYYAGIYAILRKIGKPIGTNDMWIAAVALEHKLPLLTLDAGFKKIPMLKVLSI